MIFWSIRNRFIEILAKNGASFEHRERILKDLDNNGFFSDDINDIYEDEDLEIEADCFCMQKECTKTKKEKKLLDRNKKIFKDRVENKIKSFNSYRFMKDRQVELDMDNVIKNSDMHRYGRNQLHESVVMRDMNSVMEYAKEESLLFETDNNNLTPIELAYYEGFSEAYSFLSEIMEKINVT